MKIAILTSAFPPEAEGAATHLPELAQALQERGHRVQVVAVVNRQEIRDSYPFRVRRISRSQFPLVRDARILMHLIRAARKSQVLYAYDLWWQASLAALLTGIPLVVKCTGDLVWERAMEAGDTKERLEEFLAAPKPLMLSLRHALQRFLARSATRLTVSCDPICRLLMQWGVARERIEVIPNALPPNPREKDEATYLAQWRGKPGLRLMTAGYVTRTKNLDLILGALENLPGARLAVVGDGPDLERIKALTREKKLENRVLFTGKVPRHDVAGYVKECDVLILSSRIGKFNYVLMEAFHKGKPVVATREGFHPDFVEHGVTGWLLDNQDPMALQEVLEGIASGRLTLPANVSRPVAGWESMVAQTGELLESLAS
ncbi:MAG: glycosyltransferase family 4 protein [Planctomycetota bacterium]